MSGKLDNYIDENGLVQTSDPEVEKPIYRRPGFETPEFSELDQRMADELRAARDKAGLTHADVAPLLGLHPIVYGRYERSETKMHVTRLIHLSELLGFSPIDLIMAAAPYRWGKTPAEAESRRKLIKVVESLPADAVESMLTMIDAMAKLRSEKDGK
ncbi:helix-turn-helix domain-containing protein [Metarhizobium album]|nr:helix-turn-helix transcriptional regulator [Rhizobium album]